jgi:hypothetical protein
MPTFAALQQVQSELIRKAKSGSAFLAPVTATAISETFVTGATAALATLPVGYVDLGWLSNDGMSFSRDVSTAEVTSFGSVSPTRSDVTSDTSTVTVTVMVRKPIAPTSKFYRLFCISKDDGDAGDIYIARFFPRAKVTSYAEQAFGGGDDPITWGVTMTGYPDSTLGFTEAWLFGGPGWKAQLVAMGFDAVA